MPSTAAGSPRFTSDQSQAGPSSHPGAIYSQPGPSGDRGTRTSSASGLSARAAGHLSGPGVPGSVTQSSLYHPPQGGPRFPPTPTRAGHTYDYPGPEFTRSSLDQTSLEARDRPGTVLESTFTPPDADLYARRRDMSLKLPPLVLDEIRTGGSSGSRLPPLEPSSISPSRVRSHTHSLLDDVPVQSPYDRPTRPRSRSQSPHSTSPSLLRMPSSSRHILPPLYTPGSLSEPAGRLLAPLTFPPPSSMDRRDLPPITPSYGEDAHVSSSPLRGAQLSPVSPRERASESPIALTVTRAGRFDPVRAAISDNESQHSSPRPPQDTT
jgi:hypothetical protein